MEGNKKYCLCCGEDVPYNVVERHERRELTCQYCGFTLDVENLWEKKELQTNSVALIAEDSRFIRTLLKELLLKNSIVKEVNDSENGLDFVSAYTRMINDRIRPAFVILDLNMPVMDGLTAARTMRALEKKMSLPHTPIIFFSSIKADEGLKKQMSLLAPANYINKGSSPEPEALARRVQFLLNFILEQRQGSSTMQ
ncbi:MAG: response regulator [Nitrospirae bacterium]|nr:response regulator [Nitrospirota bacterium]